MLLPDHRTKIVCTIGPSSSSEDTIRKLISCGMNVARINFSHGDLEDHRKVIRRIKRIASEMNTVVCILVDLPGPKIRVGMFRNEPVRLNRGDHIQLTVEDVEGTATLIPVDYGRLLESVHPGSNIYLNDGFIQLKCLEPSGKRVECEVVVGGLLSSRKGVNLPGSKIFLDPVTDKDLEIIDIVLKEGIDTFSMSFVEKAEDIRKVRQFAERKGRSVFLVAKIEREEAVKNIESILQAVDALMIARGDLGVEIPIQDVPVVQKELIHMANLLGKPVITATHMLESMTENTRPTRAEATDVANAIMDGTDALMLSGETAIGQYPVETVSMMVNIAKKTEAWRSRTGWGMELITRDLDEIQMNISEVISVQVYDAIKRLPIKYVVIPTTSGRTPRRISRFKPNTWILAMSRSKETCEHLALSYGVYPIQVEDVSSGWENTAFETLDELGISHDGDMIVLTQGQSPGKPGGTNLLKILTLE
ncbi:MAG: pyruvate kinase [Methanosarcinaceae archaeon]